MVRLFLKNSGTRMDQIRTGVSRSDLQETERGAHSLKSSAANIGAETLRTMATRMESAALDESVDDARALLPELESAYESAMKELATIEKGLAE
jgi:HPt (histidine-containing phosphotransfer) domain-containing protein